MAITKPPVLPAWADAGDKVQPSNAELSVGWPVSSTPPSRQRFNWVLNFVANAVRYFSRRGMPDYDAAETYMTGDRVIGDDGKTYRSLIDNNTAQTPSTSPTKWERWGFSYADLLTALNPLYISASALTGVMTHPGAARDKYGPNAWGHTLTVGGNSIDDSTAQVAVSNGTLHIESLGTAFNTYLNYFRGGDVTVGGVNPNTNLRVVGNTFVNGVLYDSKNTFFNLNPSALSTLQALSIKTSGATASVNIVPSAPGHTGYQEFIGSNGIRIGYIGWATDSAVADSGTIPYIAGAHSFIGTIMGNSGYTSGNPSYCDLTSVVQQNPTALNVWQFPAAGSCALTAGRGFSNYVSGNAFNVTEGGVYQVTVGVTWYGASGTSLYCAVSRNATGTIVEGTGLDTSSTTGSFWHRTTFSTVLTLAAGDVVGPVYQVNGAVAGYVINQITFAAARVL